MQARKYWIILVGLFINATLSGQVDSTILDYQDFVAMILNEHPVMQRAELIGRDADANLLSAKGNFDPVIKADWEEKDFKDDLYFRRYTGKLTVPTPLGFDVVGGYENSEGIFLNPEANTSTYGLWNVGIEANLLQGLLIDERRTALRTARIFQDIAANQQQILINDIILNGSEAYLAWQESFFIQQVYIESIELAQQYFADTKASFFGGEKTAVDTLEAALLLQDRRVGLQENAGFLTEAIQMLNNFLWDNGLPVGLLPGVIPQEFDENLVAIPKELSLEESLNNHPEVLEKVNKRESLLIEQRMKREKLKPKLKAKFNPLLETKDDLSPMYSPGDFKWGFDFSFPLWLRSERGGIQMGEVKILDTEFDINIKRNDLRNKIINSLNQIEVLQQQVALQQQNVEGFRQLLEAENIKFQFGESSVFLLNKRQEKYIDGQIKLIKTEVKLEKEKIKLLYYLNALPR